MALTKRAKAIKAKVDRTKSYPFDNAIALIKECATATPVARVWESLRILHDHQISHGNLRDAEITVDDGTVFRFGPERFRWVGYTDEDEAWFAAQADRLGLEVSLENSTDRLHNLAVQGPASREILERVPLVAEPRAALSGLITARRTTFSIAAKKPPPRPI